MDNKKEKKSVWGTVKKVLFGLLMFALGVVGGGIIGYAFGQFLAVNDFSTIEMILNLLLFVVFLVLTFLLHVIIHEGGHLIFGLLSGYKFSSFRIGSFNWSHDGEKVRFSKLKIAGTGGQCLMSPPDLVDGTMPTFWYNMGGACNNLIVSVIFMGIYFLVPQSSVFAVFCFAMIIWGVYMSIINGVPLSVGSIDNDGKNMVNLQKNKSAIKAFWIGMKISDVLAKGGRVKDCPEEWFYMPEENEMQDAISTTIGIFYENRLIDMHKFDKALEVANNLLDGNYAMTDLHRHLLKVDIIFLELLNGNTDIEKLYDKKQKSFMKQMISFPTVVRTTYAIETLVNKDEKKAQKTLESFEKIAKSYPYQGDIQTDRELIDLIRNV